MGEYHPFQKRCGALGENGRREPEAWRAHFAKSILAPLSQKGPEGRQRVEAIKEDTFIIPQFYRESRVKKENGRTISKMPPKDAAAWISGKKQIGSRRIGLRGGSGLGL